MIAALEVGVYADAKQNLILNNISDAGKYRLIHQHIIDRFSSLLLQKCLYICRIEILVQDIDSPVICFFRSVL